MPNRKGATLLELITTIFILSLLASVSLPAVFAVRERSRSTACANNLRQVGMAVTNFESSYRKFPPGTLGVSNTIPWEEFRNDSRSKHYWKNVQHTSFAVFVLPQLEQQAASLKMDPIMTDVGRYLRDQSMTAPYHTWFGEVRGFREVAGLKIHLLRCPSDSYDVTPKLFFVGGSQPVSVSASRTDAFSFLEFLNDHVSFTLEPTSYLACAGAYSGAIKTDSKSAEFQGVFSSRSTVSASMVRDGLSATIMIGESLGEIEDTRRLYVQPWVVGGLARGRGNVELDGSEGLKSFLGDRRNSSVFGFGSAHSTVNFVFADGAIHEVSREIDIDTFSSLCGMADGLSLLHKQ